MCKSNTEQQLVGFLELSWNQMWDLLYFGLIPEGIF